MEEGYNMSALSFNNQNVRIYYHSYDRVETFDEFIDWGRRIGIEPKEPLPKDENDEEDFIEWLKKK